MAIKRVEEQRYATVLALQNETIVPGANDVVFVESLWRGFRWKAGDATAQDGAYVIDQTSETLNGRWVAASATSIITGSGSSDAVPVGQVTEFNVTVTGASVAGANLPIITNNDTLVGAGLSVISKEISAANTVTVRLKNDSNADVASQTVNVSVIVF